MNRTIIMNKIEDMEKKAIECEDSCSEPNHDWVKWKTILPRLEELANELNFLSTNHLLANITLMLEIEEYRTQFKDLVADFT